MNNTHLLTELAKLRPSSTFLSLAEYTNAYGEIANYNLSFNISYTNALERSLATLDATLVADALEARAKRELKTSFEDSLRRAKEEPIEERDDGYTHFADPNTGFWIKGVKLHNETNTLHLYGLVNSKSIITPGNYPVVNRRPLTIAKDRLRSLCAVGRFRQFIVAPGKVKRITVQKTNLLPEVM